MSVEVTAEQEGIHQFPVKLCSCSNSCSGNMWQALIEADVLPVMHTVASCNAASAKWIREAMLGAAVVEVSSGQIVLPDFRLLLMYLIV